MPSISDFDPGSSSGGGGLFGSGSTFATAGGDLLGGVGSLVGGMQQSAADMNQAAIYGQEVTGLQWDTQYQMESGYLQGVGAARAGNLATGATKAEIGAHGLTESGSAADLVTESAVQSKLNQSVIQYQSDIKLADLSNQIAVAQLEEKAAKDAASGSLLGGILGAVGGIAKASMAFL